MKGNPGEIAYYSEFMSHINRSTKLPLIGLSNGGHNRIPTTHSYPKISGLYHIFVIFLIIN
jgi:hypothetical protein